MDTYYVCNGNLVKNDTQIDPKDTFIIEEPFELYDNSNQDESLQLQNDLPLESRKRNCREWSQYETKILMDMYKRNVTQVGPMKKFKSKREMFKCIAQTISTKLNIIRSAHQCQNRYKTVVNQLKVEPTILRKTRSNIGKNEEESQERSQSDVTASVSADHDYNGQNSGTNGKCPIKSMSEWGIDDTKLLMELYRKNISKVGLERTFRTKLKMFEHIANVISDILNITRTGEQCLNRYKTIFRRKSFKKNGFNNNNSSMNNTIIENYLNTNDSPDFDTHIVKNLCETEFNTHIYDGKTLRKIVRQPKIVPKIIPKELDMNPETLLVQTLKDIAARKEKTLLKIAANQECAHERRHQEQLALIRHYGEQFVQCFGIQTNDTTEHQY